MTMTVQYNSIPKQNSTKHITIEVLHNGRNFSLFSKKSADVFCMLYPNNRCAMFINDVYANTSTGELPNAFHTTVYITYCVACVS